MTKGKKMKKSGFAAIELDMSNATKDQGKRLEELSGRANSGDPKAILEMLMLAKEMGAKMMGGEQLDELLGGFPDRSRYVEKDVEKSEMFASLDEDERQAYELAKSMKDGGAIVAGVCPDCSAYHRGRAVGVRLAKNDDGSVFVLSALMDEDGDVSHVYPVSCVSPEEAEAIERGERNRYDVGEVATMVRGRFAALINMMPAVTLRHEYEIKPSARKKMRGNLHLMSVSANGDAVCMCVVGGEISKVDVKLEDLVIDGMD